MSRADCGQITLIGHMPVPGQQKLLHSLQALKVRRTPQETDAPKDMRRPLPRFKFLAANLSKARLTLIFASGASLSPPVRDPANRLAAGSSMHSRPHNKTLCIYLTFRMSTRNAGT